MNILLSNSCITYLCRTAISLSMLFSLPSNAVLGIHLIATNFWVLFSSARTTSEKAPLKHKQTGQSVKLYSIYLQVFGPSSSHAAMISWRQERGYKNQTLKLNWPYFWNYWTAYIIGWFDRCIDIKPWSISILAQN